MRVRAMIDTNALIRYLGIEFQSGTDRPLDKVAHKVISDGLNTGLHTLFLNSISFIEIWANLPEDFSEANRAMFKQAVKELYNAEFLRVAPIDSEILEKYTQLDFQDDKVKEHDRIILASAVTYGCDSIITCDHSIIELSKANGDRFKIY
jgi:predicted nucleic acid-binding protein